MKYETYWYRYPTPTFIQFLHSLEYDQCKGSPEEKGWMPFLQKFQGYNDQVALAFAKSFDGEIAQVGNLSFKITEESISKATGLPADGEKFFKGG